MDAGGPGDAESAAAGTKVDSLPRGQTHDARAGREFGGAVERGEDAAPVEELAAEVVEVVPVVLVGEEDRIYGRESIESEGRRVTVPQNIRAVFMLGAGR